MMTRTSAGQDAGTMVRVWDPMVRIFHWSLVAAFAIAFLTAEDFGNLHEIVGYVVAGLVAFRVIWGVIGGKYARFAQFVRGPSKTIAYLRDMRQRRERRYLGHNPAGAAMIVAMLLALSGTAFTGWLMAEPERIAMLPEMPQIVSPAYAEGDEAYERSDESEAGIVRDVHEMFANLMLFLIALHVGGVVLASVHHKENLVKSMVRGDKRAAGPDDIS